MSKTIDRLMEFIQHVGLSARQFDLSIGAGNGYTLRMVKNKASVGSDVIETVLRIYPQLSVVWLLTGNGKMIKSNPEEDFDFSRLSREAQLEIERIIERKIRERQETELKELLKEVSAEIGNQKGKRRRNKP